MISITVTTGVQGHGFTYRNLTVEVADNLLHDLKRDPEVTEIMAESDAPEFANFNFVYGRNADGEWR